MTAQEFYTAVSAEVGKVLIGKEDRLKLVLTALLADGHVLLEDLPGVGKTTLVKALGKVLGCRFSRIQFTPDLLPSDITGMTVYDRSSGDFRRVDGPVMTNLLLADELNRAIPRTQSALLEAMEERQVTIDGVSSPLPRPFFVLATQNPVESETTFRLPAAQLDRFALCLSLGYPEAEQEKEMLLQSNGRPAAPEDLPAVTSPEELLALRDEVEAVFVSDSLAAYVVELCRRTREHPALQLGASPRAAKVLYRCAKAYAALEGRGYVLPDDVRALAEPVLCHRLVLSSRGRMEGKTAARVMNEILDDTPVPPELSAPRA